MGNSSTFLRGIVADPDNNKGSFFLATTLQRGWLSIKLGVSTKTKAKPNPDESKMYNVDFKSVNEDIDCWLFRVIRNFPAIS